MTDTSITETQELPPEHRKDIRLAAAAYRAALEDKWDTATHYVKRISDECGGEGLNVALMAWSDWFADHATDGAHDLPASPTMNFIRTDTGQLDRVGSPNVPAHVQWAGRVIAARAAKDEAAWMALIDELPEDDGYEIATYVGAVLKCVTLTVNGLPRGYARMGQGAA
jgi:hypothetical protein